MLMSNLSGKIRPTRKERNDEERGGCRRRLVGGLQMAWKRMCYFSSPEGALTMDKRTLAGVVIHL